MVKAGKEGVMTYSIKRIGRTVELNDALVEEYLKYEDSLRDQPFSIVIRSTYGHEPSESEVSNEELSRLCNEVLLSELKAIAFMPEILKVWEDHKEEFAGKTPVEYRL